MRQIFCILALACSVYGQNWQEMKGIFNPSGLEMKHFTAPFFFDVDGDGDKDLNLCYLSSRSKFYINQPENGLPRFSEDTSYLSQIAVIDPLNYYSYAVFGDLTVTERWTLLQADSGVLPVSTTLEQLLSLSG